MRHAGGQSSSMSSCRVCCSSKKCVRARRPRRARVAADTGRDRNAARHSTGGEPIVVEPGSSMRGIRIPTTPTAADGPSSGYFGQQYDADVQSMTQSIPASPERLLARAQADERDVVLLENGLMLERVDLRRQSSAGGRARNVSLDKGARADDRMSTYSTPMPVMPHRYPSPPIPASASTRSGRSIPRAQSQNAERRSLFGGLRASVARSTFSLAPSRASAVNLQYVFCIGLGIVTVRVGVAARTGAKNACRGRCRRACLRLRLRARSGPSVRRT